MGLLLERVCAVGSWFDVPVYVKSPTRFWVHTGLQGPTNAVHLGLVVSSRFLFSIASWQGHFQDSDEHCEMFGMV